MKMRITLVLAAILVLCLCLTACGHKHAYTQKVVAPTCTAEGYTEYTCECGDKYTDNKVAALGHTEVEDAAVAATCTEAGKTAGKHCSVCNAVTVAQNEVAALGHTEVEDAAVAATCTEAGKTAGKHCSVCNTVTVAQTEVAALDHDFAGDLVVDVAPTWDAEGSGHYACSRCGVAGESQVIEKDSSKWHLVCPEGQAGNFVLDADGNLTAINTAASTADLWLNMFAINDQIVNGAYMVEATFDPTKTEGNEKGAERTYGIVAWYVDSDNFLIYWMQQKAGDNWSGQFYGKVGGEVRKFAANNTWSGNEWDDMWWDGGNVNPEAKGVKFAVIQQIMGLRVVSKLETIQIDGVDTVVRKFELHHIYNGNDYIAKTYYIKGCVEAEAKGNIRTGVYSNKMDIAVSDFTAKSGLWSVVSTEANKDKFTFDTVTGDVSGANTADGADLWLNMYAMYGVELPKDYTVEATFDPTASENNGKGAERTYGIVAYYKDADNFLIYWIQQKPDGAWSGQFYGKIGGQIRNFTNATEAGGWIGNEWDDMWWDSGKPNSQVANNQHPLLSTKITLKVVSKVTTITVGGESVEVRSFELHQIVGDEDKILSTYYIKNAASVDGIYVGVYANNFDLVISDFSVE